MESILNFVLIFLVLFLVALGIKYRDRLMVWLNLEYTPKDKQKRITEIKRDIQDLQEELEEIEKENTDV